MDVANLKTASSYVNNLLLARGLLRNGTAIDFAALAAPPGKNDAPDAKSNITAQIINLVHDLILQRDRDQEHQESVAATIRSMRSEAARSASGKDRLVSENKHVARQLSLCQSSTRAARAAAQSAEAAARALRDELARVKTALAQVRTACANDVRKRDMQIARLQTHLSTQQRGSRTAPVPASITIVPGNTVRSQGTANLDRRSGGSDHSSVPSLDDAQYSLKQETTEFLTQLSASLSDENDALIGLIRQTLRTLREVQGITVTRRRQASGNTSCTNKVNHLDDMEGLSQGQLVHAPPASYDVLAGELNAVLGSLRDLLTNPSFAPIEEVQVREDEIQRLREGWERMESRWKEAVLMMQGWRRRMLSGGDTVNLDELKMGLRLGQVHESDVAAQKSMLVEIENGDEDMDVGSLVEEEAEQGTAEDLIGLASRDTESASPADDDYANCKKFQSERRDDLEKLPPLQELDANAASPLYAKSRKVSFRGMESNAPDSSTGESLLFDDSIDELADTTASMWVSRSAANGDSMTSAPVSNGHQASALNSKSRNLGVSSASKTSTHSSAIPPQRELTVGEKLKHAEAEARRMSLGCGASSSPLDLTRPETRTSRLQRQSLAPVADGTAAPSPTRKSGIAGRPQRARGKRKKSTLSPEELEVLLGLVSPVKT